MGWGFVWLMVVLKIPIGLLLWLVWWAIRQEPDDASGDAPGGDGGSKVPLSQDPNHPHHPHPPFPRRPRGRGPHGDPTVPPPPRTRTLVARSRMPER
jgi:hypothetical protein